MNKVDTSAFASEYPWQGHMLEIDGHRLHYLDEGPKDAPVLLCIHGNPTWSFYWRNIVKSFAGRYRVIVPDHIGCGMSDKPGLDAYDYTLKSRVSDLTALVSHLGLSDITLLVHDWGGMIGLAWAVEHPEAVVRYFISNTAGFGLPQGRPLPWQLKVSRNLPFSRFLMEDLNLFVRGAIHTATTEAMSSSVQAGYLAPYHSPATRVAIHRFVQDIPLDSSHTSFSIVDGVSKRLETLQHCPTMVVWGGKDFVFDRHFLAEWKRRWPGAEYHEFPDAGHYVLEDRRTQIMSLLEDFLDKHPLSGGAYAV